MNAADGSEVRVFLVAVEVESAAWTDEHGWDAAIEGMTRALTEHGYRVENIQSYA